MKSLGSFYSAISLVPMIAFLNISAPVGAADEDGQYAIRGTGSQNCSALIDAAESQTDLVSYYLWWMQGYVSSTNLMSKETFDAVPFSQDGAMEQLLLNVCRDNPDLKVEVALAELLHELAPIRATGPSELLEPSHAGASVEVRKQMLLRVQRKLRDDDYYSMAIDGLYGPGTRNAIFAFQKDAALEPTGLPDASTIIALLLNQNDD